MTHILAATGVLICAAALAGLAAPAAMAGLATRVGSSRALRGTAIAARIVFGAIAIIAANETLYPLAMKIIGVVAIMAGTLTAFIDADSVGRRLDGPGRGGNGVRMLALGALVLGVFVVHASA